ncbi:MAG TPA: hypothetical protein VGO45_09995 [Bacteroidia bacterium]|nr:hypothetical protein [Bacteroidia bacterium]
MNNMTPLQNLHYALGEMAYCIAKADGQVQEQERKKFHDIVAAEMRCGDMDFDLSDIIFSVMDKEGLDAETSYNWAMKENRLNSYYLSPELKETFIKVMEKMAKAWPPVTISEKSMLDRFKKDIAPIHGDPAYYANIL